MQGDVQVWHRDQAGHCEVGGGALHKNGLQVVPAALAGVPSAEERLLGVWMEEIKREPLRDPAPPALGNSSCYLGNHVITGGYYWGNIVDNNPMMAITCKLNLSSHTE